jgi:hypothetical protein
MKSCPYCAEQIQEQSVICRYCKSDVTGGLLFEKKMASVSPDKKSSSKSLLIFAAIFALILWVAFGSSKTPTATTPSAVDLLGKWVQLKEGYVMAPSKELFDKADNIVRSKDEQATTILLLSGQLKFTSTVKEEVYVENIHSWSGYAEVRLKGSTTTWWTNAEAVLGRY